MGRIEARLQTIAVDQRPPADQPSVVSAEQLERAATAAEALAGAHVLYVSAAPLEAADSSRRLAPLLRGLGIEVERVVLHGDAEFQRLGRELADALRGAGWEGDENAIRELREACEAAAVAFDLRRYDAIVAQGVAAAALIEGRRSGASGWVWRTGLDFSAPDPAAWRTLRPLLLEHAEVCFALSGFVPAGVDGERLRILPGCFDPLAEAQRDLGPAERSALLRGTGVDPSRPLVVDVTALDRWADPLASIEAWLLARREAPGLQLAFVGRIDPGDPQAPSVAGEVRAFAGEQADLQLLTRASAGQLGALTRIARCVLRSSLGEEFDPELSAARWRGSAVVAGGAGAAAQVRDEEDGFIVTSPVQAADRIARLASDPRLAVAMSRAGREHAAKFAAVQLLADELGMIGSLLAAPVAERAGAVA